MRVFIVSGLSGSGKTIALNALEDAGLYCVDNLPPGLLATVVDNLAARPAAGFEDLALGIDARAGYEELQQLETVLAEITARGHEVRLIFLQAEEAVLIKRYSETRRKHPLTHGGLPLVEAIRREREMLSEVAVLADLSIDTSHLTLHELNRLIQQRIDPDGEALALSVLIQSFGFKHGVPLDSDFVFDLRCLPNPYWEPSLRPHTGRDAPVIAFLERYPEVNEMYQTLRDLLERWIPQFQACNRSYVTVSIGCTGGRHRSVFMVERLAAHLRERFGNMIAVKHREL